jgi:hypothetical protein
VLTRGGLAGVAETLARLPLLAGRFETQRVLALVDALVGPRRTATRRTWSPSTPRGRRA